MLAYRGKLGSEEDAVVGKIIEEKEYLFLATGDSTAVFEIKTTNNQYKLTPVSKNINITFFDTPSTLLTVQSHPNKKEHMVALPYTVTNYNPNIEKYGKKFPYYTDYLGYVHYTVIGFPQAYIPENFNDDKSPYVWDGNFIYGEWVSQKVGNYYQLRFAPYIHGRRPFKIVDNKLVAKNISARKNDPYTYTYYGDDYSGPFHIQWKDESGNWVRGIDLPYETYRPSEYQTPVEKYRYLAILGIDKTIHIKDEEGKEYKLIVGSTILHTTPGYTRYDNLVCECDLGCGIELYGEERTLPELEGWPLLCSGEGSWGFTTFRIIPCDYDNMNGDDTFIMFFAEEKYSRDQTYFKEVFIDNAGCCATRFTGTFGQESSTNIFYLAYRSNSSEIQTIKLAESLLVDDYFAGSLRVSGERITGMSSQINDKNMVYTYIVERYDNNKWVFEKRIVGIINIADTALPIGYRQELELDFSGTNFDPAWLAAIGVTR
jgi:hypothetical protein